MALTVGSYSNTTTRKGIGGLASGLDTDTIVEQMTAMTRSKIAKQVQNRELTIWKRDSYREVSSKLMDFNNKYFSYSSSTNNIMSRNFFNSATVNSSSSLVKYTGDSQKAKDVRIRRIELAEKAYSKTDSAVLKDTQTIKSAGALRDKWKESNIGGQSMTISYGGKTTTLTVGSDIKFDKKSDPALDTPDEQIAKVIEDLTKQLKKAGLADKLEFTDTGTGADRRITLKEIDGAAGITGDLKVTGGSVGLLSSLGIYASPDSVEGSNEAKGSLPPDAGMFFLENKVNGSAIYFEMGSSTALLSVDKNFRFSAAAMEKKTDGSGEFTQNAYEQQALELQKAYETGISNSKTLSGNMDVSVSGGADGLKVTFKAKGGKEFKIVGGTNLEGLGFKAAGKDDPATSSITSSETIDVMGEAKDNTFGEMLKGSSINVTFNGVTKAITFDQDDIKQYDLSAPTPPDTTSGIDRLVNYMNKKLDKAFGTGRVQVTAENLQPDGSGSLSVKASDSSSTVTMTSASKNGILGETGALRIRAGDSTCLETNTTLRDMKKELGLTSNDKSQYDLTVNGVKFVFEETATVGDVMSKINANAEAGVQVTFSSITNSFQFTARESGAGREIVIGAQPPETADVSNLGEKLFGVGLPAPTDPADPKAPTFTAGKDATIEMSFDGGNNFQTVVRSENTFTIDGMGFEFTGAMALETDANKHIKFSVESNVDELVTKIKDFVKDYNEAIKMMTTKMTEKRQDQEDKTYERYMPLTDEQKKDMSEDEIKIWTEKAKKGIMQNDPYFDKITTRMRQAMGDKVAGTDDALYQIGITSSAYAWSDNGALEIDEEKLKQAILENPERVTNMFTTAETGISARMKEVLEDTVGTTLVEVNPVTKESVVRGLLLQVGGRTNSPMPDTSTLTQRIEQMGTQITTWQKKLVAEEERYYAKFTQLEKYISAMNSQSSWLSQQTGG